MVWEDIWIIRYVIGYELLGATGGILIEDIGRRGERNGKHEEIEDIFGKDNRGLEEMRICSEEFTVKSIWTVCFYNQSVSSKFPFHKSHAQWTETV